MLLDLDPVIFSIGNVKLTWYGLAYAISILLALWYISFIDKKFLHTNRQNIFDNYITYLVLGVIIGGRMGYVIFYNLENHLDDPISILKTWEGGMSFHGGLIGVIISSLIFCKKYKIEIFKFADLVSTAAPIGFFFGRIANFINGELYGKITDVSWAVIFPMGGSYLRHPSQLYEAFAEGFILFIIVNWCYSRNCKKPGLTFGVFLIGYSLFRIIIENFREPDLHIGYLLDYFSLGQLLSFPMLITGIIIIINAKRDRTFIRST